MVPRVVVGVVAAAVAVPRVVGLRAVVVANVLAAPGSDGLAPGSTPALPRAECRVVRPMAPVQLGSAESYDPIEA